MLEAISISWERGFHCHRAGSAVMYRRRGTVIDMENSKEYYVRDEDGQIVGFNYDCIGADENLKISLRQLAEKIFGILKVRFKHTFDIGTELRLAKTAIKFGGFTEWLETVALGAGYSRKTFGNWMAVAKRFGPPLALIADLDFPKSVDEFDIGANAAVTLTKCSDKGIIEAVRRAANGEKITDDVAKEILSRLPAPPKAKGKETATNKESTPAGKPAAPPVPDASNPEQAPVENGAVEAKGEGTPSPEEPSDTGAEGELAGDSPELAQSAIVAKEMGADECAISVPSEDATSDSADVDDNTNPDPRVLQVNKTGDHYAAGTWNIWNIKETDTDDAWGGPLDVVPPSSESQAQQNLLVCHGLDGKPKDEIAQAMQRIISIAKQAGQWNYLINFQSDTVLPEIECPQNVGIGIDVRSQDDLRKAIVNLKSVRTGVRYVRSRPMAKLDFSIFEEEGLEIHWLVLGLNDGEKASLEYAADAYDQARKVGIPIYCLDDLVIRPTEHPVVEVDLAA